MIIGNDAHYREELKADLEQARHTSDVGHNVVIKFKEIGLPQAFDKELAALSTDLGDLWSAQKTLVAHLDGLLKSPSDWEAVGDYLVDLRASIDHITWHLNSVRKPLKSITRFAYRKALEHDKSSESQ